MGAIASLQAAEAIKILTGKIDQVRPYLLKFDLWSNDIQRIELPSGPRPDCPCCKHKEFEFLEP